MADSAITKASSDANPLTKQLIQKPINRSINQCYLEHRTCDNCQCYLCNDTNASILFNQLNQLKQVHKRAVEQEINQQRSRKQIVSLQPIDHACLHIHATVGQWFNAVLRSTRNTIQQSLSQSINQSVLPASWRSDSVHSSISESRQSSSDGITQAFVQAWDHQNGPLTGRTIIQPAHRSIDTSAFHTVNQSSCQRSDINPLYVPMPCFATPSVDQSVAEGCSPSSATLEEHCSNGQCEAPIQSTIQSSIQPKHQQISSPLILPVLSARSGLSIYLTARDFRRPSLVLVSAITIPDILSVLRAYDLVPVPIDFCNSADLEVDIDALHAYRSSHPEQFSTSHSTDLSTDSPSGPKVVAVLFAHLWGKQSNIQPVIDWSLNASVEVWEDMAECWRGFPQPDSQSIPASVKQSVILPTRQSVAHSSFRYPYGHLGHPSSDLVLLSFGTIKHATAFGGGILIVSSMHQSINESITEVHQSTWPVSSDQSFLSKLSKIGLGMLLLNFTQSIKWGKRLTSWLEFDHKRAVVDLLRGFGQSDDVESLIVRLNQSPSLSLLQTLEHRLISRSINQFVDESGMDNTIKCEIMTRLLNKSLHRPVNQSLQHPINQLIKQSADQSVEVPGLACVSTHYWLYPILTPVHMTRSVFINRLERCGIDAYMGATQLAFVEPDQSINRINPIQQLCLNQSANHSTNQSCPVAYDLMARVIYLPVHRWVDIDSICRMAAIIDIVAETSAIDQTFDAKLNSKL